MIHAFLNMDVTAGLATLLAVSVLIILVMLARRPVARRFGAQAAYMLWAIPLVRLVLPPLPAGWTPALPIMTAASTPAPAAVPAAEPTFAVAATTDHAAATPVLDTVAAASINSFELAPVIETTASAPGLSIPWVAIGAALLAIWGLGALFVLARSIYRHHTFISVVRREAVPASPRLQHLAGTLAKQLGMKRAPRIGLSLVSSGPMVTGLARPIILLPAWFEDDYTLTEQRSAVAHELTHIRRGDLWALQLAEIFVAALWFNPLAYMARRGFRSDQEAACDSDVLRSGAATPHEYGSTLVKAVRLSMAERMPAMAAGLPMSHGIKERLLLMTGPAPSRSRRWVGNGIAGIVGAAALMLTATSAIAHPHEDSELEGAAAPGSGELTVHGITTNGFSFMIDGKEMRDRQFIMLADPFEGVHPSEEEMERLHEITREGNVAFVMPVPPVPPMEPMPPFPAFDLFDWTADLEQLEALEGLDEDDIQTFHENGGTRILVPEKGINIFIDEAEIEARAEAFEKRAEVWAEQMEEQAERWAEMHEAHAEAYEARAEEWETKLEHEVEALFGDDFENRIEMASETVEELAEGCRDAELADGEIQVLEFTQKDGKTFKATCSRGSGQFLFTDKAEGFILNSANLTKLERRKFFEKRDQHRPRIKWVHRHRSEQDRSGEATESGQQAPDNQN